jgi:pilus assembly protein CpaF
MTRNTLFFIGAKGGVGTTTIASSVAKKLASDDGVLLVDGDLTGRRSIGVVTKTLSELDDKRAQGECTICQTGQKLAVYEMAGSIHDGFTIKHEQVEEMLADLPNEIAGIVVDAPQPFAAAVRPLAVRASLFLLVIEPSTLGVTGARVMQYELSRFGVPASRLAGVISVRDPRARTSSAEMEKLLGIPILGEIPPADDRNFDRAIGALAKKIGNTIEPIEHLLVLQPSATTPIGDRRLRRSRSDTGDQLGASARPHTRRAPESQQDPSARDRLKAEIHRELSRRIDFVAVGGTSADQLRMEQLRTETEAAIAELIADRTDIGSAEDVARLRQEVIDEALGLGPLEDLFNDADISEVMVNGPDDIYVERHGMISRTEKRFNDTKQLRLVIERIISPIGRHIDEASPMVDARLPDGSRVNATIEPLSIDGPTITIRRFAKHRLQVEDLIEKGSLNHAIADLMRATVEGRLNVVISGGTGSGKTTLLNVLSGFVPTHERIITIEDAAELQLIQDHVVRLEARPANMEGRGEIRIRDLVRNALRMRPDRIVVGECRSGEALDMLQAMNTGHDGSLTTVHANSPRDCLSRIETMVLMAGFDIPVRAIREQIAGAVDVIVQIARMRDGSRKLSSISEVVGMEGDVVTTQEIVRYDQHGLSKEGDVAGQFVYTGVQPSFMKRFDEYGISFDIRRLSEMQLATAGSW